VKHVGDRADIATTVLAGDAYAALGDWAKARAAWRASQEMALANPEPFNRQWTLFQLEHGVALHETRALLEREIAIRQDVYGWDQLALARYLTGDISGAKAAIDEAMTSGTQDANLLYHAAIIARAHGDTLEARLLAGKALAINPRFHHRDADKARTIAR
ncbi:MAG: hypothetical protein ACREOG_14790, partial [Gemmatimonadaceae bacterium]